MNVMPFSATRIASLPIRYISTLLSRAATMLHSRKRSRPAGLPPSFEQMPTESLITIHGVLEIPAGSLSAFERLPTEILLTIRDMMDPSAQILLGLTCKRLYNNITRPLDPTLYTTRERIDISKCLEIDCHKYLTCRQCGTLFNWQRRALYGFSCPVRHKIKDTGYIRSKFIPNMVHPIIYINLETIDLISRYYERGPRTGVSPGWLNQRGVNWANIPQETKARWVYGQLIVYTQWTLEPELIQATNGDIWKRIELCYHSDTYWKTRWTLDELLEHTTTRRCSYCACDAEISQQTLANDSVRVIFRSWCNYGNSRSENLSIQQHFRSSYDARTNQDTIAPRNLRELFDGGEDETNDEEIKRLNELLNPTYTCSIQ